MRTITAMKREKRKNVWLDRGGNNSSSTHVYMPQNNDNDQVIRQDAQSLTKRTYIYVRTSVRTYVTRSSGWVAELEVELAPARIPGPEFRFGKLPKAAIRMAKPWLFSLTKSGPRVLLPRLFVLWVGVVQGTSYNA